MTTETLIERLNAANEAVNTEEDPLRRLNIVQQALALEAELARRGGDSGPDLATLEKNFIKYAKPYSESKGITYAAWREVGVAPSTLKAAGTAR